MVTDGQYLELGLNQDNRGSIDLNDSRADPSFFDFLAYEKS